VEVVTGGGENGVGAAAVGSGEVVSAHAVLRLRVADGRFDGGRRCNSRFGDAASLARDIDPELVARRGVVATIAAVGDDAGEARADLRRSPRSRSRVCGHRWDCRAHLAVGDELAAGRATQRGGDRHLDAEFVGPMRLALADAFDLGRMQRVNLLSALMLALLAHPAPRA
jgi:hypothetical protein